MKKYTIYTEYFDDDPKKPIATITGDKADKIIDMLFDYNEWADYEIFFDTIWAEEDSDE